MAQPTVIFTAVQPEAAPLIRRLRLRAAGSTCFTNNNVVLQITGMGQQAAAESARRLLTDMPPQRVIIAGLCGALDPTLKVADILHITRIITCSPNSQVYTPTLSAPASTPSPAPAVLLTADHLIATADEKTRLHQQTGAHIVDMESAAIAAVCNELHIPWCCLRAVSDTADEALPVYLANMVDPLGRPRPWKLITQLLPHPSRIGTLLHIARQSKAATSALADAVTNTLFS